MSSAMDVNEQNFQDEVVKSEIPVLVDFWATWCNPCKMIAPMIDKIAKDYEGKMKVVKVDVDSNPGIASTLGIRSIPTLMIFKGGDVVEQVIGVAAEAQLKKLIDKNL